MQKKLTLSVNAEIYEALHKMAGKRKIGRFIEDLVRPHLTAAAGSKEITAPPQEQEAALLVWPGGPEAEAGEAC